MLNVYSEFAGIPIHIIKYTYSIQNDESIDFSITTLLNFNIKHKRNRRKTDTLELQARLEFMTTKNIILNLNNIHIKIVKICA